MIINCEWGAFNNSVRFHRCQILPLIHLHFRQRSHLPFTPYDSALDRLSINPRYQAFEKFISGMYLGELVRHALVSLVDAVPKPLLFSGHSSPVLNKQYGFDTSFMSAIELAWIGEDSSQTASTHPAFSAEFKREDLSPQVVSKLETIRHIIVQQGGLKEAQVSLRDAAVSGNSFACAILHLMRLYELDCSLDMFFDCA